MLADSIQNSMVLIIWVCILTSLIGLLTGLGSLFANKGIQKTIVLSAILQLVLPPFFVISWWMQRSGGSDGWNLYSMSGAIWLCSLLYWPIPFFLIRGCLQQVDRCLLESEPLLRGMALVRHALLPSLWQPLCVGIGLVALLTLNQLSIPSLLQVRTWSSDLLIQFSATLDWRSTQSSLMGLVTITTLFLWVLRFRKLDPPQPYPEDPEKLWVRHSFSPVMKWLLLTGTCLWVGLITLFPLVDFLGSISRWKASIAAISAGQRAVSTSLVMAAFTASFGLFLGWSMRNVSVTRLGWILLLLPGSILGVMGLSLIQRWGILQETWGLTGCLGALTLRYGILGWAGLRLAHQKLDPSIKDLSLLEMTSAYQRFRHATLPQSGWILGLAWYGMFLLCLWDAETLLFLIPPGEETLSLRIFNLLHYGHTSQVDGLLIAVILLAILPTAATGLGHVLNRRWFVGPTALVWTSASLAGWLLAGTGCQEKPPALPDQASTFFESVRVIGSQGRSPGFFIKPRSLTVDSQDYLYVVDMTGRVQKFDADGHFLLQWQMPELERGKPKGMGIDAQGNIVVIEPHYSRINHFTPEGQLIRQWGKSGADDGHLTLPRSFARQPQGNWIISEYQGAERLQVFDEISGQWRMTIGQRGALNGQFNRPEGVTCDAPGNIYVADSCNHRIQVFTPGGQWMRSFGNPGLKLGSLSYPYDIVMSSEGHLYVCEFGNSRIQIFDPSGLPIEILGGPGASPGMLSNPWAIALDSKGNLYVADAGNHRVQKWIRKVKKEDPPQP